MFNINLKYRLFLILAFCVQIVSAQVVIDTIGTAYERVIKNDKLYYTYQDVSDQLVELENTNPMSTMTLNRYIRSLTGAIPVWNGHTYFLKNGKLVDRTMEKICDTYLEKVYGKVEGNFLVGKKDSCFLLFENCEMKFLKILSEDFRIDFPRNCTNFFFRDKTKSILHIFDSTGNEISQIDGYIYPGGFYGNRALIKGDIGIISDRWITALYNYNGQMIAKGELISDNSDVTIFRTLEGEKKYYFKDQEIPIPKDIHEITPFLEYVEIKLKNGNVGLLSNSLERTIIPPKYKVLGLSKHYNSDVYLFCDKPEIDRFIYAFDSEKKLAIFNSDGEEIKLKDNLSFYVIHNRPDNIFYIFDKEWNFIAIEKKDPNDYYFLVAANDIWFLVPISVLKHFREKIDEDDFFNVKGVNPTRNNIIDSKLQLVYKDNIGILRKINNNHFILNHGTHDDIDDRILIKLSRQ